MKIEKIAILMSIVLFLLILFTYARFNHIEQRVTQQRIEGLNLRLDSLIATIRDSDSRYKSYTEDIRRVQDRVDSIENEKKDLWAKVENLSRELEKLQAGVLAAKDLDTGKQVVELGAINVKKAGKTSK